MVSLTLRNWRVFRMAPSRRLCSQAICRTIFSYAWITFMWSFPVRSSTRTVEDYGRITNLTCWVQPALASVGTGLKFLQKKNFTSRKWWFTLVPVLYYLPPHYLERKWERKSRFCGKPFTKTVAHPPNRQPPTIFSACLSGADAPRLDIGHRNDSVNVELLTNDHVDLREMVSPFLGNKTDGCALTTPFRSKQPITNWW